MTRKKMKQMELFTKGQYKMDTSTSNGKERSLTLLWSSPAPAQLKGLVFITLILYIRGHTNLLILNFAAGLPNSHFLGFLNQLFLKVRMGNGNQKFSPLPCGFSLQINGAKLGNHIMGRASGRGYNRALGQGGHD